MGQMRRDLFKHKKEMGLYERALDYLDAKEEITKRLGKDNDD